MAVPKDEPAPIARPVFQPFTFGGVARFASARIGRVFLVGLFFATLGGAAIGRIAAKCWSPVITEAVVALPPGGGISGGELHSKEAKLLGANTFLAISMGDTPPGNADLSVQFRRTEMELTSLYGDISIPYPAAWSAPLNSAALVPFWGAWQAPCVFYAICAGTAILMLNWCLLALPYAIVPLFLGVLARREVSFWRVWKLSMAAQWPGSLIMSLSLAIYSTGEMSLLFLAVMFAAHFVPTLIYLLGSPFCLPKLLKAEGAPKKNPFQPAKKAGRRAGNPFSNT
jgi:hypothetical protein